MPKTITRPRHPSEVRKGKSAFGVSPGYLPDKTAAVQNAHLDIIQDVGAAWVRIDFNWAQIEPTTQGTFAWTAPDQLVTACVSRGLRILGVFINSTPSWARGGTGTGITLPTNPFNLGIFAAAVQARYPFIRHWEIGNEVNNASNASVPNIAAYGSPSVAGPTGRAYAALMRGVYPTMKNQDPDCFILTAGLWSGDSGTVDPKPMSDVEFIHGFYYWGGQPYCDGIAIHPYCQPFRPGEMYDVGTVNTQTGGAWSAWGRQALQGYGMGDGVQTNANNPQGHGARVRTTKGGAVADVNATTVPQVMALHGDGTKPLWVTEYGAHTGTAGVTQAEQAVHVKRFFSLIQSNPRFGPGFWYSAKDLGTDGSVANSWGLQTSAGVNKTAYATYKALAQAAPA